MPWTCRFVPDPPLNDPDFHRTREVGMMWWLPWDDPDIRSYYLEHALSRQYLETHLLRRHPIIVVLPGIVPVCLDEKYCGGHWGDNPTGEGWQVTGEPPKVTVQPSINLVGVYHGWLHDGVLSDDVEGRRYDARGALIR